jgi:hypothetical protein
MQEQLGPKKNNTGTVKHYAHFALALRKHTDPDGTIPKMKAFMKGSLEKNRNIIISSEELDQCLLEDVKTLKEMLTGFEVTIVFVYRELLSHLVSLHFELGRFEHNKDFSVPFSTYLFSHLDKVPSILDPAQVLQPYREVFGKDRIKVVDLYGVTTAKQDLAQVIVCEIAGALCHTPAAFKQANYSGASNPSYSLIHSQVFSYYYSFVTKHNNGKCRFCNPVMFDAYQDFELQLKRDLERKSAPVVPIIESHLSMLIPMAQQMDDQLRAEYGKQILYGNAAANRRVMRQGVRAESLNAEEVAKSDHWYMYMRAVFHAALRVPGRMCDCYGR